MLVPAFRQKCAPHIKLIGARNLSEKGVHFFDFDRIEESVDLLAQGFFESEKWFAWVVEYEAGLSALPCGFALRFPCQRWIGF